MFPFGSACSVNDGINFAVGNFLTSNLSAETGESSPKGSSLIKTSFTGFAKKYEEKLVNFES